MFTICILLRESYFTGNPSSLGSLLKTKRLEMTERIMKEKALEEAEAPGSAPLSRLCIGLAAMLQR